MNATTEFSYARGLRLRGKDSGDGSSDTCTGEIRSVDGPAKRPKTVVVAVHLAGRRSGVLQRSYGLPEWATVSFTQQERTDGELVYQGEITCSKVRDGRTEKRPWTITMSNGELWLM